MNNNRIPVSRNKLARSRNLFQLRKRKLLIETLEERRLLAAIHDEHSHGLADPDSLAYYQPPTTSLVDTKAFLTRPSTDQPINIALNFLRSQADKLALTADDLDAPRVTDMYTDDDTGVTHIYLMQTLEGFDVSNAVLNVHVSRAGEVISANSSFVNAPPRGIWNGNIATLLPSGALASAAEPLGLSAMDIASIALAAQPDGIQYYFQADGMSLDPIPAKQSYFANEDGQLQPAWEFVLRTPDGGHWYNVSIDATNGSLINGADWVNHATYNVFPRPVEHPEDGVRSILADPHDTAVSPFGWHDTNGVAGAEFTDVRGNNVFAQEDTDNNNTGGTRPDGGASLAFDFPLDLAADPSTYSSASLTNLFYWNNLNHDIQAKYGFTEAAGNFQQINYSGQGSGGDPVQADGLDGSGTNNANFGTPPDGYSPRMQMYRFTAAAPDRDSSLDSGIITHEFGHGVSNRLTGGPANSNGLREIQSGGMGEGWADFYALMLLQRVSDTANTPIVVGAYSTDDVNGIRRNPYSFEMTINPITFNNYNSDPNHQVHNTGEIWASTLWDLNWLLIAKYGYNANLRTGYTGTGIGAAGNKLTLQLVNDGLKLQPSNPSFTQARDAILLADLIRSGGANQNEIWQAFARRGLGVAAATAGSYSTFVTTSFVVPTDFPDATKLAADAIRTTDNTLSIQFDREIKPSSFTVAGDVVSLTGPGGSNAKSKITGFTFSQNNTTLNLQLSTLVRGNYTLVLGPNVLDLTNKKMDQDLDGVAGEAVDDRASFNFVVASNLIVTSSTDELDVSYDATDLSLREAVNLAERIVGDDTITYAPAIPANLIMTLGQMEIHDATGSLTISTTANNPVSISGNTTSRIFYVEGSSTLKLNNIQLTDGFRNSSSGGAIYNRGIVELENTTISNSRSATVYGGAIQNDGKLFASNSTFSGNRAVYGGAILSFGDTTLINTTITNNTANGLSFAAGFYTVGEKTQLINTMISGNFVFGSPASKTDFLAYDLGAVAGSNNLIGTVNVESGLVNGVNGNLVGITDPLVTPLQSNGGPTPTHGLLTGSPAFNAGTDTVLALPIGLALDQRGFGRKAGLHVDIGASEKSPHVVALGGPSNYTENGAPIPVSATASVTKVDDSILTGGRLVVANASGDTKDLVTIRNAGDITLTGNAVKYLGTQIGTYSGGLGTTLRVQLNVAATTTAVQSLIRALRFRNSSEDPIPGNRNLTITIQESDGLISKAQIKVINVIAVNDAPVLTGTVGALNYVNGAAGITLMPTGTVKDVDSSNFEGGTLRVSVVTGDHSSNRVYLAAGATFTIVGNQIKQGTIVIGTITADGIGTNDLLITLTANANAANVQQMLRLVRFRTLAGSTFTDLRTLRFRLIDGDGGTSNAIDRLVNVS